MATSLAHAHLLLRAFRASKPAFGAWLTLPGALNARVAASASPHLSWVLIDCEHGMTGLHPGANESISAIAALGPDAPSTIVRIPATGACADASAAWQIKYVLDQGARGVLVPMVRSSLLIYSSFYLNQGVLTQIAYPIGIQSRPDGIHRLRSTLSSNRDAGVREPIYSPRLGTWSVRYRLPTAR